jgi:hypothetical protein
MGNFELKVRKGNQISKLKERVESHRSYRKNTNAIINKYKEKREIEKKFTSDKERIKELSQGVNKRQTTTSGSTFRTTSVTKPKFLTSEKRTNNTKTISIRKR